MDWSTVDAVAKLIENHGAMVVFAIVSGFCNVYLFTQLAKGNLIPRKMYEAADADRDRLQTILDDERKNFMAPLLGTLQGLKRADGGEKHE